MTSGRQLTLATNIPPYGSLLNLDTNATISESHVTLLLKVGNWFTSIHGYTSIVVCIFGICTNIINITVLARKDMRNPTNLLLSWLAVSDILTMVPYIPFVVHFYCTFSPKDTSPEKYSYPWIMYMLFLINFTVTTHTISIWLGVSLAVFRFVQLRSTLKTFAVKRRLYSFIKKVIMFVYTASTLILIPNYLTNEIDTVVLKNNQTLYGIKDQKLATNNTRPLVIANVVIYGVVMKLIPCVLMTIFSVSLLVSLNVRGRNRQKRLSATSNSFQRESRKAKTTRMLLAVIILFLLTEFPQGLLIVLSATVSGFFQQVYEPLGDLLDFVALINNAINFVLYCSMSTQFRTKLLQMYFNKRSLLKNLRRIKITSLNKTTISNA